MNILVTGSSGYIGNSFMNIFKNEYTFFKFSLLENSIESINFDNTDIILHCAAIVHQKVMNDDEKYTDINMRYPVKLAKEAKKHGVKHFVFISTIAVYGDDALLLKEDTRCNPITSYGKSKLEAEQKLLELKNNNFQISIIRPPIVYGKNAPGNMKILLNLIKNVFVLPFAKIDNKRSMVYIGNLCHLLNEVIRQRKSGIFLASDDETISTSKLIRLIANSLEKKIYLIRIPLFETLLHLLKPSFHKKLYGSLEIDNTLTKKELNLKNPYSVEDGIKLMIQDK